jgi:hypothetical protein
MRMHIWVLIAALVAAGTATEQGFGQSAQGTQQSGQTAGQGAGQATGQQASRTAKTPSREVIYEAHKDCADLFAYLAADNTEEAARWMADEVGFAQDDVGKATLKDGFKTKLDAVMASPPQSPYGKFSGYDLLDEAYLPNSARYFRLVYISYHEGAPLIWEFRFYVKPDGRAALESVEWSEKNPFEYMATPEMLYPKNTER